jgi:hypothetical protein
MKLKTTPWHLECHNCHGEGSIEWTATSWNGNQSSSRGHSETCEYCNGEGSYEIPGWVSEKDISECCPTYFRKEDIEDFLDPEALAQFKADREPELKNYRVEAYQTIEVAQWVEAGSPEEALKIAQEREWAWENDHERQPHDLEVAEEEEVK